MAEVRDTKSAARRQSSRLQTKAPASIQISPATERNVAIPLLSPLIQSPIEINPTAEIESSCAKSSSNESAGEKSTAAVVAVKNWQHPAAPFCYDPAPFLPFVCFDR